MITIGIATYSYKIRRKKDKDFLNLGDLGQDISTREFFSDFLKSIKSNHSVNENDNFVLSAGIIQEDGPVIKGILYSGEYGYSADGVNINTKNISYTRTPSDAEIIPFYFLAYLPDTRDTGIIILQRHGNKGIRTVLDKELKSRFSAQFPDHVYDLNQHIPGEVLDYLEGGELKSIELISYEIPHDRIDTLKQLGFCKHAGSLSLVFKANRNEFLEKPDWLRRLMKDRRSFSEISSEFQLPEGKIKISINYLGKPRNINLDDLRQVSPYIDATDDLTISSNGHPEFENIDQYCNDLLDRLLNEMGTERHV